MYGASFGYFKIELIFGLFSGSVSNIALIRKEVLTPYISGIVS